MAQENAAWLQIRECSGRHRKLKRPLMFSYFETTFTTLYPEHMTCHCDWFSLLYLLHIASVAVMEKLNIERERLMDLVQLKHHVEAL